MTPSQSIIVSIKRSLFLLAHTDYFLACYLSIKLVN
jgi:hypothetical protein